MTESSPIRVLVVDDHWIVRQGLTLIIERDPGLHVAESVATGEKALTAFEREHPDVILMDLELPVMSGTEVIRAIRRSDPDVPIVVLTMHEGGEEIHAALEAGATTCLLKGSPSDDLIRVIYDVYAGERPMRAEVRARLEERAGLPPLTPREIDVLRLVLEGNRNKEIAGILSISEETVEVHLRNVFSKLDVHDRTAAVYVALQRGIIHVKSKMS